MLEEGSTALEVLKQYYKINKRIINIKINMTNLRFSAKTDEYEKLAEELKKLRTAKEWTAIDLADALSAHLEMASDINEITDTYDTVY